MYCIYSSLLHLCSYCGPISLRTTPSFHFLSCISPHLHTHDSLRKRERKARGRRERRRSSDSYTIENTTIINLYFLSFFSAVMMESEKEVGATQLLPHFWSKKRWNTKIHFSFTFHLLSQLFFSVFPHATTTSSSSLGSSSPSQHFHPFLHHPLTCWS